MTVDTEEVRKVLILARNLIADPERWTTTYLARDAAGKAAHPLDPVACRWCSLGALVVFAGTHSSTFDCSEAILSLCARDIAPDIIERENPERSAAVLNDRVDHATVIRMFDCAIAKASN